MSSCFSFYINYSLFLFFFSSSAFSRAYFYLFSCSARCCSSSLAASFLFSISSFFSCSIFFTKFSLSSSVTILLALESCSLSRLSMLWSSSSSYFLVLSLWINQKVLSRIVTVHFCVLFEVRAKLFSWYRIFQTWFHRSVRYSYCQEFSRPWTSGFDVWPKCD